MPNVNHGLLTIPRDQRTFQSDGRRKLSGMDEEGAPNTGAPTEQVLPRGWPKVVSLTHLMHFNSEQLPFLPSLIPHDLSIHHVIILLSAY